MSLLNRLITLNLLDLPHAIPTLPQTRREQVLNAVVGEIQAALQEANEQVINLRSKHVQDESSLVGVLRNIQDLNKAGASVAKTAQLTALQEAKSRLEEDLNGLELDEQQLRQELNLLEAKLSAAEKERSIWMGARDSKDTSSHADKDKHKKAEVPPTPPNSASTTAQQTQPQQPPPTARPSSSSANSIGFVP
jgi:chromosome segregation ATPase